MFLARNEASNNHKKPKKPKKLFPNCEKDAIKQAKAGQLAFSPESIFFCFQRMKMAFEGIFQPKITINNDKIAKFIDFFHYRKNNESAFLT